MSRLCAKPTCSGVAVRWFDVDGAGRRVLEQHRPTTSTIALCEPHADRFSAPTGWTWVPLAPTPDVGPMEQLLSAPTPAGETLINELSEKRVPQRRHPRETPWFLVGAPTAPTTPDSALSSRDDSPSRPASNEPMDPSAGSLLHRAFHGPDRELDSARALEAERDSTAASEDTSDRPDSAPVASVRDIASRRSSNPNVTSYDVELPFPPMNTGSHVAVS